MPVYFQFISVVTMCDVKLSNQILKLRQSMSVGLVCATTRAKPLRLILTSSFLAAAHPVKPELEVYSSQLKLRLA